MAPVTRLSAPTSASSLWSVRLAAGWSGLRDIDSDWTSRAFVVLAGLAVLGELFPIRVPFRHEAQEVTLSTAFVLGILVTFGLPAAIAVQVVGSLLSDCHLRKVWWKAAFNVGQYTIAWTVGGVALVLVHGGPFGSGAVVHADSSSA